MKHLFWKFYWLRKCHTNRGDYHVFCTEITEDGILHTGFQKLIGRIFIKENSWIS